jgi:hypothetical protein
MSTISVTGLRELARTSGHHEVSPIKPAYGATALGRTSVFTLHTVRQHP